MAVDRFGVSELITGVDPDAVRFCPIHRVAFDPDPTIYRDAGRCCPVAGERLVGFLARWREADGSPLMELPLPWDEEWL